MVFFLNSDMDYFKNSFKESFTKFLENLPKNPSEIRTEFLGKSSRDLFRNCSKDCIENSSGIDSRMRQEFLQRFLHYYSQRFKLQEFIQVFFQIFILKFDSRFSSRYFSKYFSGNFSSISFKDNSKNFPIIFFGNLLINIYQGSYSSSFRISQEFFFW